MSRVSFEQLLKAGAHFGHLKRKWHPSMKPYIFMERNGIHIIDLHKTVVKIDEAAEAIKQIIKSRRKILFVATKKQIKQIVSEKATNVGMPYLTERWSGGTLTNFPTIRKTVQKMTVIDRMSHDGTFDFFSKREKLQITRKRTKLEKNLGSIIDLKRLPSALFVIDIIKDHIAVSEARHLNIPVFAIVDTNANINNVDFVIPANDDATTSVEIILNAICNAIIEEKNQIKIEHAEVPMNGKNTEEEKLSIFHKKRKTEEEIKKEILIKKSDKLLENNTDVMSTHE